MEAGSTLKHYRILSRLGEGGMGVVYRAEDIRLGRTVALKVLPESLSADQESVRRFEREARAASAVSHPSVATLYDFDRSGDTAFLSMEYVEGRTLKECIAGGPLELEPLLDCLSQVAEGLAAAHRKGVVHRDLKPENVMASDSGFYKILDFGLARMAPGVAPSADGSPTQLETVAAGMTSQGMIVGTFAYMSPEQAQAEPVDPRSDVFSFGVLLHELATGQPPFRRKNAISTFHAIVHEEPEPISSFRDDIPPELERIAAKCLAKDPDDRYQSAADLAVDLRHLRRGSGAISRTAVAPPVAPRKRRPGRRPPLAVLLPVLAVAAVGAVVLWLPRRPAVPPPGPAPPRGEAARPVARPAADNRLAISPFADRTGDPDSAWLSQGIPDLLTTDLARVPGLEVISTQRLRDLLAAAGREGVGEMDERTVTQLARWAGAGIVIGGSIYRSGGHYRIDVQAFETGEGQVLAASRAEGTDVFALVDRLAAELLAGLKMSDRARDGAGLGQVLTASAEAYRRYAAGLVHYQGLRLQEAAAEFAAAAASDPGFALARLRRGLSLHLAGDAEEGVRLIRESLDAAARLPERDRSLARGVIAALGDGDLPGGEKILTDLAERYPEDTEPRLWHARVLAEGRGDRRAAIGVLQDAMELDPHDAMVAAGMIDLLRGFNLHREADGILADFLERNPRADRERVNGSGVFRPPGG